VTLAVVLTASTGHAQSGADRQLLERLRNLEANQAAMQKEQAELREQLKAKDARLNELESELHRGKPVEAVAPAPTAVPVEKASSEVVPAPRPEQGAVASAAAKVKSLLPEHVPNAGFRIYEGEHGQIYMRLMTYVRYLNQKALDSEYTDAFGNENKVKQRHDIQLTKFFLPFSGWFLTPKMRYYLYVWSANTAQGDPAQVVGAGNINYNFNRYLTLGGGIGALPTTRSTEGQFPYWLGVDDRLTSDEFFRGSYTTGVWVRGTPLDGLNYMVMVGNNLSTLGVGASRLDNGLNTTTVMLNWMPTTKEFGPFGAFGDYEMHDQVATRLGTHFTYSREDKQSQPGTDSIENSQLRLTDGTNVFTDDIFGVGTTVQKATYQMMSVDAGIKYKGFALEAEGYSRWLTGFDGPATGDINDINDTGYQLQASAMVVPTILQGYVSGAQVFGKFGDTAEARVGMNWWPFKQRGLRVNAEWLHLDHSPVGYTAVPYPVGGNGEVFTMAVEMNF